jgi:nonsense-mediated mRNA decay protein 3
MSAFPKQTASNILCCLCGVSIKFNAAAMCDGCLASQVDITEGIPKEHFLLWCKQCLRINRPPWVFADFESRELLAICLRTLPGLSKVKLLDANFIWTEPHSKRVKVRLDVQKEALGVQLKQTFVVEYVLKNQFCPDCHEENADMNSTATVQVRQHVDHKRTFFYLEQLIIKHKAQGAIANLDPKKDGIDFKFNTKSAAAKFVQFLKSHVPVREKKSKSLVGKDRYEFTWSVEIIPVCADDLLVLSKKQMASCGSIGQVVICTKIAGSVHLLNPSTLEESSLNEKAFYRDPLEPAMTSRNLVEFVVLDSIVVRPQPSLARRGRPGAKAKRKKKKQDKRAEILERYERDLRQTPEGANAVATGVAQETGSRYILAEVTVARASDLGVNDTQYTVYSHLGQHLKAGDSALGFDMTSYNGTTSVKCDTVPDVVLVKKMNPPKERKKRKTKRGKVLAANHAPAMGMVHNDVDTAEYERFVEEYDDLVEEEGEVGELGVANLKIGEGGDDGGGGEGQ